MAECPGGIIIRAEGDGGGEAFNCERPLGHKGRHRAAHYDDFNHQRYALEWTDANPPPKALEVRTDG